ncbi:MAG: translation initiation factor [Chitinophagales bacterium]|nr:translation initiation factor [Chitinophagales bacterium]MDW8392994.1 translation initiation factor [Chitinophagales bacterium]
MSKSRNSRVLVYSTTDGFSANSADRQQRKLWLRMERRGRGGKTATIIGGFTVSDQQVELLARRLKSSCGIGGNVVDGEIVLQGDVRQKASALLRQWGYPVG